MIDNFKDHPRSIAEIRADRSDNAADWTPRDALISALRWIDSGDLDPEAVVIAMRVKKSGEGVPGFWWNTASPDIHISLGLLSRAAYRIQETAEEPE